MLLKRYLKLLCLLCLAVADISVADSWQPVTGKAVDIAIGAQGTVVAVNQQGNVYRFNADQTWSPIGRSMSRIAVAPNGDIWGVDVNGHLRRFSGAAWQDIISGAQDIIFDRQGLLWATTNTNSIAQYNPQSQQWQTVTGSAKTLAVDAAGVLWRIDPEGNIARRLDDAWVGVIGKAQDISADSQGRIYIAGMDNRLYQWNEGLVSWQLYADGADMSAVIIASDNGQLWRADTNGDIFAQGLFISRPKDGVIETTPGEGGSTKPEQVVDPSPIVFTRVADNAKLAELSIGADGSVFGLTTAGNIRRWSNSEQRFNSFPGRVEGIVIQDSGLPLAIGTQGNLVEHDGEAWRLVNLNLGLTDISIADDGAVFVINNKDQLAALSGSLNSYRVLAKKGQRIAAGSNNELWLIDAQQRLFKCDKDAACERQSVNAQDLAIGPAGSVFIIDTTASLRRYKPSDKSFEMIRSGNTARVAVGPKDRPWILDNQGLVYQSGYFDRDESKDRQLALKTIATQKITQTKNNTNTGVQITQSISFTAINIPTVANGFNLGTGGLEDITSGVDDIVIATGFSDPCVNGTGRNWVYNPIARRFSYLDYLKRINLYVAIAVADLFRGSVNGDTPPAQPSPAIPSLIAEWEKACGNQSNLISYVNSVFSNPSAQASQNFDGAVLALPLDVGQLPDLDVAADGTIANIAPSNELELFQAKTGDDVEAFDDLAFHRVGIGKDKNDIWVVSTTNNVYEYSSSQKQFVLRSIYANDKAQDVGVGHDGTVFIVNTAGVLKKWDASSLRFIRTNKTGVSRVAVDSRGKPIVANFPDSQIVYFAR